MASAKPAAHPIQNIDGTPPPDKKISVLESHGYYLGKSIGTGSYATVRVDILTTLSDYNDLRQPKKYHDWFSVHVTFLLLVFPHNTNNTRIASTQ